ncbi:band 4.1-like protein 4A isoform X3 [Varroa destructor]|uniref:FERM domain-containing protein n=1 Tax=Varroa destructor TaxID=109461 RepID=A0A7M7MHF3_VARDE|nr:band 4.1-like protein 4A isoform X3 [Varroa destructor]
MKCFGEKAKTFHCKVLLLDNTELIQELKNVSRGQDLLDAVHKHLNLLETAYFGLRYIDATGQTHWMDATKKIYKQMKGVENYTFYFGVKYYAADPCKLLEEITRYQFFLQVKRDILHGRVPLTYDLAAQLFAFAVQSELGDFDPRRHNSGYISEFRFVPDQTEALEEKVVQLHKTLIGQVPAQAELNFLDRVKWLDMYGVDLHPVLGEDHVEYYIGLTPAGIVVLKNKTKVGNYFWPRIGKVYYKGCFFMLQVKDKSSEENTYGFELPNKAACKHLWKCCVDHHSFFRLAQSNPDASAATSKLFGFGSKLRNSLRGSSRSSKVSAGGPTLTPRESRDVSRPQPTFTRVPSRRYQMQRLDNPDGADATSNFEAESRRSSVATTTQSTPYSMYRSVSVPSVGGAAGGTTRAWDEPRPRGLFSHSGSANPSPRSVRSIAMSARSYRDSSVDSMDCFRHRKRHRSRHERDRSEQHGRSDAESEVSRTSRNSRTSRASSACRHSYHSRSEVSGSECESVLRHSGHRHRQPNHQSNGNTSHRGSALELVDSQPQWLESQKRRQQHHQALNSSISSPQSAVVRSLTSSGGADGSESSSKPRCSGYVQSGVETESEAVFSAGSSSRKRHRKHRSKSPGRRENLIPHEVRRLIEYNMLEPQLAGPNGAPVDDIKYTKVETDSRLFRIRYNENSQRRAKVAVVKNQNPETGSSHSKRSVCSQGPNSVGHQSSHSQLNYRQQLKEGPGGVSSPSNVSSSHHHASQTRLHHSTPPPPYQHNHSHQQQAQHFQSYQNEHTAGLPEVASRTKSEDNLGDHVAGTPGTPSAPPTPSSEINGWKPSRPHNHQSTENHLQSYHQYHSIQNGQSSNFPGFPSNLLHASNSYHSFNSSRRTPQQTVIHREVVGDLIGPPSLLSSPQMTPVSSGYHSAATTSTSPVVPPRLPKHNSAGSTTSGSSGSAMRVTFQNPPVSQPPVHTPTPPLAKLPSTGSLPRAHNPIPVAPPTLPSPSPLASIATVASPTGNNSVINSPQLVLRTFQPLKKSAC